MANNEHSISVIILTKNSEETIAKCLESIFNQTIKPDEVIVIDGHSKDNTLKFVKQFSVKLFIEPGLGYGYARNYGVQKAKGDIIFFIDSDCYAEPNWIEKALPHFKDPNIVGVTGPTLLWNTEHACARFLAYIGGRMEKHRSRRYVEIAPTMNLAIRRNVIFDVGGFDETLIRGEDTDLTYRITRQHKIIYEPEAVIWFKGSPNVWTATHKCVRHFIGVGQLLVKHGFKKRFFRFNLLARGFLTVTMIISIFILPFYAFIALFILLLTDFVYKLIRMYNLYHDRCVIYYAVFFTLWSLASFAIFYGLYIGLKNKLKNRNS